MRMLIAVAAPAQYDAAVDPSIAATKVKGHTEVAGQANVLVFPNLNSGNVAYKVCRDGPVRRCCPCLWRKETISWHEPVMQGFCSSMTARLLCCDWPVPSLSRLAWTCPCQLPGTIIWGSCTWQQRVCGCAAMQAVQQSSGAIAMGPIMQVPPPKYLALLPWKKSRMLVLLPSSKVCWLPALTELCSP